MVARGAIRVRFSPVHPAMHRANELRCDPSREWREQARWRGLRNSIRGAAATALADGPGGASAPADPVEAMRQPMRTIRRSTLYVAGSRAGNAVTAGRLRRSGALDEAVQLIVVEWLPRRAHGAAFESDKDWQSARLHLRSRATRRAPLLSGFRVPSPPRNSWGAPQGLAPLLLLATMTAAATPPASKAPPTMRPVLPAGANSVVVVVEQGAAARTTAMRLGATEVTHDAV